MDLSSLGTAAYYTSLARDQQLAQQRQQSALAMEQQTMAAERQKQIRQAKADESISSFYTKILPGYAKQGAMSAIKAMEGEAITLESMNDPRAAGLRAQATQMRADLKIQDAEEKQKQADKLDERSKIGGTYIIDQSPLNRQKLGDVVHELYPGMELPKSEDTAAWMSLAKTIATSSKAGIGLLEFKGKADEIKAARKKAAADKADADARALQNKSFLAMLQASLHPQTRVMGGKTEQYDPEKKTWFVVGDAPAGKGGGKAADKAAEKTRAVQGIIGMLEQAKQMVEIDPSVVGVKGMATRFMESVKGAVGIEEITPAHTFETLIRQIQSEYKKSPYGGAATKFKADAAKVDAIIRGLEIGASPQSFKESADLMIKHFQQMSEKDIDRQQYSNANELKDAIQSGKIKKGEIFYDPDGNPHVVN